jgi:hypothetical protein
VFFRAIEKLKTAELETCQDVIERCTLHDLQRLLGMRLIEKLIWLFNIFPKEK